MESGGVEYHRMYFDIVRYNDGTQSATFNTARFTAADASLKSHDAACSWNGYNTPAICGCTA